METTISKSEYLKPHHLNHLNEWNDANKGMKFNQELYVKILENKKNNITKPLNHTKMKEFRYFIEYTGDPNKVIVSIQQKHIVVVWWFFTRIEWLNIESHTINPIEYNRYYYIETVLGSIYKNKLKKENTVMHPHIFSNVDES